MEVVAKSLSRFFVLLQKLVVMKKPWLWMLISGLIGFSAAWMVHQHRYGRGSSFGPFSTDNDLTADTVSAHLESLAPKDGNPKLVVVGNETVHDFGIMAPGSEGERIFEITNDGTSDLNLRLGASTCKCTIGTLEKDTIPPGETTQIKLNWTVKLGEESFSQSAQVLTNDPAIPALTLAITGKIVQDIAVVPPSWSFGEAAAGDPFEVSGTIYNFMDRDIKPLEAKFSSTKLTELAEFSIEPFQPTEAADGVRSSARQAFRVVAKVDSGVPQGSLSPQLIVEFQKLGDTGNPAQKSGSETDSNFRVRVQVNGRVVGPLSMILNERIKETAGSYIFDFGRITENDPLTATAFVVLKGNQRDNTSLRIGEVYPDDVVKAKLGEPKGSGTMKLYPLEIELIPGTESVERQGKHKDDYGSIWIESDNEKVSKMRVALKFSLDGR